MNDRPISELFKISMDNLKKMIDVDTVVGKEINLNDRITIIPISKVKCVYATGGTEMVGNKEKEAEYPFGGATGGTINITPIAFLTVVDDTIKMLHVEEQTHLYEKIIDQVPEAISTIKDLFFKPKEKEPIVKTIEVIERNR